jgi:hypothetical protein
MTVKYGYVDQKCQSLPVAHVLGDGHLALVDDVERVGRGARDFPLANQHLPLPHLPRLDDSRQRVDLGVGQRVQQLDVAQRPLCSGTSCIAKLRLRV